MAMSPRAYHAIDTTGLPAHRYTDRRTDDLAVTLAAPKSDVPIPPPAEGGWGYVPEWGWGNFPPGTPPAPEPEPPDQVVVFEDMFRDGKLDQSKWFTRYIYTGPDGPGTLDYLNDEWQRFRETGNHVFDAGGLCLAALPPAAPPPDTNGGNWYPSGMLRSKELFDLASGDEFYFECNAKVPRGKGVWPAFWLAADAQIPNDLLTVRWPPEIDIMEIVNNAGEDTTYMLGARCQVLNWDTNPQKYSFTEVAEGYNGDFSVWYAPFDFADDFHQFGLYYKRPNFTIYCDRSLIVSGVYDWVWDDGTPAPPAHILCNLAIGGSWAGRYGVDDSAFPQALQVDYIRVYAKHAMTLPQGQIGRDYEVT
jgi:hypothetical protein